MVLYCLLCSGSVSYRSLNLNGFCVNHDCCSLRFSSYSSYFIFRAEMYLLVHEADVQNWKKIRQVTTSLPQEWIIERLGGGKD